MEKKKLKIGIDLDDVVFEFVKALIENFSKIYKKRILFKEVFTYNFSEVCGLSPREMENFILSILTKEFVLNLGLCEFSKEVIQELSKKHEIYFVTSRFYKDGTLESLEKHFSCFELHFSSNPYVKIDGPKKSEICNNLKIDFMVEDNRRHALDCADAGIKVFLIDKPWNQNCEHKNITRFKCWKEILDKIKEIENGN